MSPFRVGVFCLAMFIAGLCDSQETSSLRLADLSADEISDAVTANDSSWGTGSRPATIGSAAGPHATSVRYDRGAMLPEAAAEDAGFDPLFPSGIRSVESTWYTREDYFHWREELAGVDFVNEYGLLLTLGYQRRVGQERYRAELFGGTMYYDGGAQFSDGSTEPLDSKTGYLGLRGEYDFLFEPDWLSRTSLLIGLGSRFWFRDLRDGVTESGVPVLGYQETWWTIYPYLGAETRRVLNRGPELFVSSRIGCTAMTYEHATFFDAVLYPKTGLTGQIEAGLRGPHFFCSAIAEVFAWRQSSIARGAIQPESTLFTVGLKAGVNF